MPTLRSATAGASPAATPSPAAASTPRGIKRWLTTPGRGGESPPPTSRHTSPHRSTHAGAGDVPTQKLLSASPKSSRKRLYGDLVAAEKPKWNPRDPVQVRAVKEALHVATVPSCELVCRDNEQRRVFEFCTACVEEQKAGSLYVCGCPGTGKTLSINKVKESLVRWADEMGMETPDSLAINCTNLANTSDIFSKILGQCQNRKKGSSKSSPLQQLQSIFSNKESAPRRMMLVIADEMDYLITRDRAVLHDLFMLTTYPYSRCILIGIANAIDLADRFLPKLESLNCKPLVVTFRAYSKDQISDIIKHRLKVLKFDVFEPLALEFCARKVAAATGDMRKALGVCRSAVEVLEARLDDPSDQELGIVTFDHMDIALSKAFKSAVVDSILCLPQQQQMVLCALASTFQHCKKKATTLGELNKSYIEICRSTQVPAVGMLEFSNMCMLLSDQGFMKLGQSKEDKRGGRSSSVGCQWRAAERLWRSRGGGAARRDPGFKYAATGGKQRGLRAPARARASGNHGTHKWRRSAARPGAPSSWRGPPGQAAPGEVYLGAAHALAQLGPTHGARVAGTDVGAGALPRSRARRAETVRRRPL